MRNLIYVLFVVMALGVSGLSYAQKKQTISGKVISAEDKQPLLGATVSVLSKEKGDVLTGVATDFDGNFEIELPSLAKVLSVSFIGYATKEIKLVSGKKHYEIALEEEFTALDEVVLTGYQKIEARKLTASVTKLKTEDVMQAAVASVDQLIAGQVAGLETSMASGAPGEIAQIRIRGTSSLQGMQDPLWVVDGLPLADNEAPNLLRGQDDLTNIDELKNYSIAGINPEDIQDITVLKDAAATAIYGARAANGVIVVTTKKGQKGTMKISFSGNTFMGISPNFDKLNLMNSREKVDFELSLARRKDLEPVVNVNNAGSVYRILSESGQLANYQDNGFSALPASVQSRINELTLRNTNWHKLLYRNTLNKQYTASVSGSGERSTYYFSLGHFDEEGTTVGTGFKRYTLTFNNSYQITKKLKTAVSVLGSHTERKTYLTDTQLFTNPAYYMRKANPYLAPFDENGNYVYDKDVEGERLGIDTEFTDFNIFEEQRNTSYNLKNLSLKSIFDIEYKFLDNLNLTSQLGIQLDRESVERYAQQNSYYNRNYKKKSQYVDDNGDTQQFMPDGDIRMRDESRFFQYNWKTNLQYDLNINNIHEFDVLAGIELRRDNYLKSNKKEFGYNPQDMTYQPVVYPSPRVANNDRFFKNSRDIDRENAYASFYGTGSYTYKRRYTVFGSIRYDGSNLFGADPKYKYLPLWAISGAWTASEENFLKDNSVISFLKLRASYGFQGNIDRNTSAYVVGRYTTDGFLRNSPRQQTIQVESLPNAKLRWETTKNYDAGLEIGLFNNRIRLEAEAYKRISTDLLGTRSLPLENGFVTAKINWAQMTNTGYSLALHTQNIRTKDFQWNSTFTLSHNKNMVTKEEANKKSIYPSLEGYPINAIFVFKTNGLDANGLPVFVDKNGNNVTNTAEYFKLYQGYGGYTGSSLSYDEIQALFSYAGDRSPKFTGGFNNTFRYKNIDLTVSTNFSLQRTVQRTPPYKPVAISRGQNYTREVLDAWSPENTDSSLPRIIGPDTLSDADYKLYYNYIRRGNLSIISKMDTWIRQMSYLRVSSIRLGYSLDSDTTKKIGVSSLRFTLEGRNLFVVGDDYTGYFDPETYGYEYAQPVPKSVSLGVSVTF